VSVGISRTQLCARSSRRNDTGGDHIILSHRRVRTVEKVQVIRVYLLVVSLPAQAPAKCSWGLSPLVETTGRNSATSPALASDRSIRSASVSSERPARSRHKGGSRTAAMPAKCLQGLATALCQQSCAGAGMVLPMSEAPSRAGAIWLTYQQVAERLGLRSAGAAAARARRGKWPKRIKNDTLEAEVCVPADLLAAGPQKQRERHQPVGPAADATTLVEAVAAAVAPLQALIETLSGELKAARGTNDALRDQLAAAQAEAAELRGKSAANEAALEREVIDRRALQQQADHIRRERRAAQERVAQLQANIREEQGRLQTTEDLVTRLKRELNEAQRAKERRGWWQWLSGRR
jgi:hypothetical protein